MIAVSDTAPLLIVLLVKVVFGAVCASIAAGRGRSAAGWFFIGLVIDCFGLILVLVLPDLKQQQEREQRVELENRRLREQLAKERQVADHRHGHIERRLGAHDQALGLDTSTPPQLTEAAAPPLLTGAARWYYARDRQRQGPVTAETIRHLHQAGAIQDATLVWTEGMTDWKALADVDELRGDVA